MSERSLILAPWEALAFAEKRKTRVTRPLKEQPKRGAAVTIDPWEEGVTVFKPGEFGLYREGSPLGHWGLERVLSAPWQPGDVLWGKETTLDVESHGYLGPYYAVDDARTPSVLAHGLRAGDDDVTEVEAHELRWCSSAHMPRKYARILREVVSVRVERLQAITAEGAMSEGVGPGEERWFGDLDYVAEFSRLWDATHGKKPGCAWANNCWVWVAEVKEISA